MSMSNHGVAQRSQRFEQISILLSTPAKILPEHMNATKTNTCTIIAININIDINAIKTKNQ